MDSDDDFGEGDDRTMDEANMRKIADKLGKDGFRIGKAQEEEKQMQIGFDEGFNQGIKLGKVCGEIYAKVILHTQQSGLQNKLHIVRLEALLMDIIPDELEVSQKVVQEIETILQDFACDTAKEIRCLKELIVD